MLSRDARTYPGIMGGDEKRNLDAQDIEDIFKLETELVSLPCRHEGFLGCARRYSKQASPVERRN